ncbi:MAG: zinc-dependent peptidase [Betaproteobacteria bacterium]|nr:zinc-dependent peptidase [Betaproteobacteria bacterium]
MWGAFKRWRRARIIARAPLDPVLWRQTLKRLPFLRGLSPAEREGLRQAVILFLHQKSIHGAAGLELDAGMRLLIAAQACILILNLDVDYYRGWVEVIVYPDEFVPETEYTDEAGVVHTEREPHTGEAWLQGPVILSWADVAPSADGVNVVIHEFAHKLDMLNGDANGFPPLHDGMSREAWSQAFGSAYADFCRRVDAGEEELAIDPYAAESPGEFFAVMSEAFFEMPHAVSGLYPRVYDQLRLFYRQDPAVRVAM